MLKQCFQNVQAYFATAVSYGCKMFAKLIPDVCRFFELTEEHLQHHHLTRVQRLEEFADFPEQIFEREEQIRKIRVAPVDVEGTLGADEQPKDDGQPRDGEHKAGVALVYHILKSML